MKKAIKLLFFMLCFVMVPAFIIFITSSYIRGNTNKPLYYYKKAVSLSNQNMANFNISNIRYAKTKENCYLFKTTDVSDASYRNVEYIIPESYFVLILSDVNSYIKKVQYNNKIGYVSNDSVNEVDFTPTVPFLSGVTFNVEENVGTQLRKSPTAEDNSNVITLIPAGTKNISYVASTVGLVPTGGTSQIWYYAIYTPVSDPTSVYEGYVYSGKTLNLSDIVRNLEGDFKEENEFSNEKGIVLNEKVRTILIIIICAPIILVFVLLVVGNKKNKPEKKVVDDKSFDDIDSENRVYVSHKKKNIIENKLNNIDDFEGKVLKRKQPFYTKFIKSDNQKTHSQDINFPSYETVDDDDLL